MSLTSTKGNRVRWVPLTRRLAAALQQHRHLRNTRVLCRDNGRPFAEYHLVDLLRKVGRRANVRVNGPHIFAALVLLASRDEGRTDARHSGTRGTS